MPSVGGNSPTIAVMSRELLNPREIVELRLHTQHLSGAPLPTPAEVVGWLVAMQAQDYPGAKWSIGVRSVASSDASIDQALADGTILRTHIMRPTWHFVLPPDIRWIQQLTASRVRAQMAYYGRRAGLDEAAFSRSNSLMAAAMAKGQRLTRGEISALLAGHGIAPGGEGLGHLLMRAELDLVICSGGLKGRQQTYRLLDAIVPPTPSMPRDEALAELAKRYMTGHGPATDRDLSWWSGLTLTDARRGLKIVGPQLESTTIGDRTYWFAPTDDLAPCTSPEAHLVQGFDEYVIAYSQSRDLLDLAGLFPTAADERLRIHVVLIDGQVVGRWRRVATTGSVTVDARIGKALSARERVAVNAAVERYGRFLGMPATLVDG